MCLKAINTERLAMVKEILRKMLKCCQLPVSYLNRRSDEKLVKFGYFLNESPALVVYRATFGMIMLKRNSDVDKCSF